MDDDELLKALVDKGGRLLAATMQQADAEFTFTHDDPRWGYHVPLRRDLQLRNLFVQAADAFDLVLGGLKIRTSAVAIGALRFLAEVYVLTCWLTEWTASDAEKKKRAYRVTLDNIVRAQRLLKRDKGQCLVRSEPRCFDLDPSSNREG